MGKKDNTLLFLVLAGIGIYFLYRKMGMKSQSTVLATNEAPSTPYTDLEGVNRDPSLNASPVTGQTVPQNVDQSALVKWQLNGMTHHNRLGKVPNTI